jgi:hypothetical protein
MPVYTLTGERAQLAQLTLHESRPFHILTLLHGIMQEACLVSGKVAVHGKLAIVTQPAWLQATTIRFPFLSHSPQPACLHADVAFHASQRPLHSPHAQSNGSC